MLVSVFCNVIPNSYTVTIKSAKSVRDMLAIIILRVNISYSIYKYSRKYCMESVIFGELIFMKDAWFLPNFGMPKMNSECNNVGRKWWNGKKIIIYSPKQPFCSFAKFLYLQFCLLLPAIKFLYLAWSEGCSCENWKTVILLNNLLLLTLWFTHTYTCM